MTARTLAILLLATVALPRAARAGDPPPDKNRVLQAAECARPYLEQAVAAETKGMTLDDQACVNASPILLELLYQAEVRGLHVNGSRTGHVFLRTGGREDGPSLYVDPTVRQFFGGRRAPAEVPTIFVGTFDELKALFKRFAPVPRGPDDALFLPAPARPTATFEDEEDNEYDARLRKEPRTADNLVERIYLYGKDDMWTQKDAQSTTASNWLPTRKAAFEAHYRDARCVPSPLPNRPTP